MRVTIHPGTMTLLPALVNSSAMEAAWVTPIVSPLAKIVTNSVLHLNYSVIFGFGFNFVLTVI